MCPSVSLSIYTPVCPSLCLSLYSKSLCVRLSVCLFKKPVCPSVCLSIQKACVSVSLSVYSKSLCVRLSIQKACVSVSLSVYSKSLCVRLSVYSKSLCVRLSVYSKSLCVRLSVPLFKKPVCPPVCLSIPNASVSVCVYAGHSYDPSSGRFTAPLSGIYVFHLNVVAGNGSSHGNSVRADVMLDSMWVGMAVTSAQREEHDAGGADVTLHVGAGQGVWVRNKWDCLYGPSATTFSGHLLHADLP